MRRWLVLALSAPLALAGVVVACSTFDAETPPDTEAGADGTLASEGGPEGGEGGATAFVARWTKRLGGEGEQTAAGLGVDESRNIYLVGGVDQGILDFGADAGSPMPDAGRDGYLARFREDGSCAWVQRIGGPGNQEMIATAVTPEGRVYATGITDNGSLVIGTKTIDHRSFVGSFAVNYDNEGRLNDNETIFTMAGNDGSVQLSFSIAALDNRFVWAGNANASFTSDGVDYANGPAGSGMFVGRRASWMKGFAKVGVQTPHGLAVGAANDIYVVGDFNGQIPLPDGGVLTSSPNNFDAFLMKLDANGTQLWATSFGDATGQRAYSVVANKADNTFLFAGETAGTLKIGTTDVVPGSGHAIFFAKMSADGVPLWVKSIKVGAGASEARIAIRDGKVLVGGNVFAAADCGGGPLEHHGEEDFFVCVFREGDGSFVAGRQFGGPGKERLRGLAWLQGGDLVVAGQFRGGAFDLGGSTLTADGSMNDIFLARLAAP